MEKAIEITGITKLFNNGRGIKDISLEVFKGDIFGFLGPNGAGKTTLMKIMTGLTKADKGKVKILGNSIEESLEEALRNVGCLIESPAPYEYMTAFQNLKIASRFYKRVEDGRINEVLLDVGLNKYKNDKVKDFSLGMKQRLGLAFALLSEPEILILDEPVNGLDIEGTVDIRNLILRLAQEKKTTIFISSHLVHEIELLCNRVGIIINGELVSSDYLEDIVNGQYRSLEDYYLEKAREGGKGHGGTL